MPDISGGKESLRALGRLERLAPLPDACFRIPGTGVRIGLDGIPGLVFGPGDLLSAALALVILLEARRLDAPPALLLRMLANLLLDTAFGVVPVAGDLFDILFRANLRNVELLRRRLATRSRPDRSMGTPRNPLDVNVNRRSPACPKARTARRRSFRMSAAGPVREVRPCR